jgi:hypothetical protein
MIAVFVLHMENNVIFVANLVISVFAVGVEWQTASDGARLCRFKIR